MQTTSKRTVTSYAGGASAATSQPPISSPQPTLDRITAFLLWCFIFSVPFERVWMPSGIGTVSRLLGLILLPVAVTALLVRGWLKRLLFVHWCMIAFVGWSALSFFWTVSTELTGQRIVTDVQLLASVLLIWQFWGVTDGDQLIKAYVYGTVISCLATLVNFANGEIVSWDRYAAEGFDPNDLSLMLAISIPLSYSLFLRSRRFGALVWLLHIGLVVVTCLLTASRMGAIVMVVALLVLPLSAAKLRGWRLATLALAIGVGVTVCVAVVPLSSWERVSSTIPEVQGGTLNDRTEIWTRGLELFRGDPLVGVGAGAFPEAVNQLPGNPLRALGYVAHNTFISVLSELGVIGSLLFMLILLSLSRLIITMKTPGRAIWLTAATMWTVGVCTLTWEHQKPTWILFALIIQAWRAG